MRKILAVIPIRSGSQGVKNKNIRPLNGRPLVSYVIEILKKSKGVEKCIVSTDSIDYANIARGLGIDVPFIRPLELGKGDVRLHHVMKHALNCFDSIGENFDAVLSLQATAPLIQVKTLDKVIDRFHEKNCQAVGTVSKIRHEHPYLAKKILEDGSLSAFLKLPTDTHRYPRQVRPDLCYFNGSIFLRDRSLLDEMNETLNCLGDNPQAIFMNDIESINIDDNFDFDIAECVLKKKEKENEKIK